MAGSVNKAILIGHLGADPEIRAAANGNKIASFTLATSERWRDKQTGERRERTEWHRIVIFNKNLVEIAQNYLKKGAHVCVEGQIVTRKWADKSGITRYTTEIVLQQFAGSLTMLGGNNTAAPPPASDPADYGLRDQQPPTANSADPGTPADAAMTDEFGDRIPF